MKWKASFVLWVAFALGSVVAGWSYSLARDVAEQVEKQMAAGKYEEGIALAERTLAGMPEPPVAQRLDWRLLTEQLARCYEHTGRFTKAADEWGDVQMSWKREALDCLKSDVSRMIPGFDLQLAALFDCSAKDCEANRARDLIIAKGSEADVGPLLPHYDEDSLCDAMRSASLDFERDDVQSTLVNAYVVQALLDEKAGKGQEALSGIAKATSLAGAILPKGIPTGDAYDPEGSKNYVAWQKDLQGTYLAYARRLREAKRYAMAGFYYDAAALIPGSVRAKVVEDQAKGCAALTAQGIDAPK